MKLTYTVEFHVEDYCVADVFVTSDAGDIGSTTVDMDSQMISEPSIAIGRILLNAARDEAKRCEAAAIAKEGK